jgi:hypothetical protein
MNRKHVIFTSTFTAPLHILNELKICEYLQSEYMRSLRQDELARRVTKAVK